MTDDSDSPEQIRRLKDHNRYLAERLKSKTRECDNLKEEVLRWNKIAEEEHRSWIRAHDALNLVRADAHQVMQERDASSVYAKLTEERDKYARLLAQRQQWRTLARRATEAKVSEAQRARELDELVEEMRQRLVETERQRDDAIRNAEWVVRQRDLRLSRYRRWCERWYRGEIGAIEVIAGITGDLGGNPLEEPDVLEVRRATEHARTRSLLNEACGKLREIEELLRGEGVDLVTTQVRQVKDYIQMVEGRQTAAEEGEGCPE